MTNNIYFNRHNGVSYAWIGETPLGSVEKRETTKTGFKRGRCIGQVRCQRYFAITPDGKKLAGEPSIGGSCIGFSTRKDAGIALWERWRNLPAALDTASTADADGKDGAA